MKNQIICRVLTGPTASGKTELGIRLARENNWAILCMDSMQIYRRMDIGTAKPTTEDMQGVPHYLLNLCEPDETFNVTDYRNAAEKLVLELQHLGQEVLFVGGTALYLQAMMHPMGMGNVPANEALRSELNRQASSERGRELLHLRLKSIDAETASRVPANDVRRVIRAIEVFEATGIPFSRQEARPSESSRFQWKVVSTAMERPLLYERINERVLHMIRRGLKEEVDALLKAGVSPEAQSMKGLGYKEMIPCLRGECSLEETVVKIQTGTRHYAKRQMTFIRREPDIRYVRTDRPDAYERAWEALI